MTVSLVCEGCGEVFSPAAAPDIEIIGPDYACADYERYACPDCGYIVRCLPPSPAPIPAIVLIEPTEDEP